MDKTEHSFAYCDVTAYLTTGKYKIIKPIGK